MYQANSIHPEDSPNYIGAKKKPQSSKKARFFANMVSLLWFYYCIGSWYGSKFVYAQEQLTPEPAILFGATFAVWFTAYFAHISFTLLKNKAH